MANHQLDANQCIKEAFDYTEGKLKVILDGAGTLGQATMANSSPVVIASDQSPLTITASSLPLPAGAATSAKQPTIGTAGLASIDVISIQGVIGGVPIPISGSISAVNPSVGLSGIAIPLSSTLIGGSDGVLLRPIKTSATGVVSVDGSAVTQPVSGPLTDAQLRATPVAITGSISATNPSVSLTGVAIPTSATMIGGSDGTLLRAIKTSATGVVSVDGSASTQPVNGTVTANIGTTNGLTLDATLAKLTIAQSTALGSNTGALIQGSVTTAAPSYTTGNINPLSLTLAGALRTDSSGTTQPVSGTLTANIGTTNGLALDATLTGGTQKAILRTAAKGTTVAGDATSTPVDVNTQALDVAVKGSVAVTGPATDTQLRATPLPVSGTVTANAGSGTMATSLATLPALVAGSAIIGKVGIDQTTPGTTNLVSIGTNGTVTANIGTLPTLTKGTQGSTGIMVQEIKDSGRTHINLYATAAASGATGVETLITLTKSSGTSATSTGTSFVITTGKTFRITSISVATRGHATATIQTTTFNLRVNTAGAVIASSTPVVLSMRSATPATASAWDRVIIPISDGFEIVGNGTIQFGISANSTFVTNAPTWDVTITGYEY